MQTFTLKRGETNETTAIDQALLRVFKNRDSIDAALAAGLLKEGEIVSSIVDDVGNESQEEQLRRLELILEDVENIVPLTASVNNMLTTVNEVQEKIDALNMGDVTTDISELKTALSVEVSTRATADSDLRSYVDSTFETITDHNADKEAIEQSIADEISRASTAESDLSDRVTALESDVTTIKTNISNLQTAVNNLTTALNNYMLKSSHTLSGTTLTINN